MSRRRRTRKKRGLSAHRRRGRVLLRLPIVNILASDDGWLVLFNGERIHASEARGRYRVADASLLFTA
jgi:hypothetical protein